METQEKIPSPEEIYKEAFEAAKAAVAKMIEENPGNWYPCGFAWVKIRPARGPFITYLKKNGIGYLSYNGGWEVNNPARSGTQWLDALSAGARAFRDVLRKYGINAIADSRWD